MKILKRIIIIVIVLVLIGSVLPDSPEKNSSEGAEETVGKTEEVNDSDETVGKTEDVNDSDETKDNVELEESNTEKKSDKEKEEVFFTKEKSVNDAINRYNERYPDDLVVPSMVEYWMAGGGNYATTVDFDDFQIEFNEGDGEPIYNFRSDIDIYSDNKEFFIERSLKWIEVIFNLSDDEMDVVRDRLSEDESEIFFDFNKNRNYLSYEENGRDYRLDYYNYLISIGPIR